MTREQAKNLLYDKHGEDDKLIDQIYNNHEAQLKLASDVYSTDKMHMYQELKAKDEEIKELGEIVQQYLIPSKNYDAIIKAKDDEIRRLNNLYADTIKDLGDALIEIEKLKKQYHQCLDDYIKCAERKEQQ